MRNATKFAAADIAFGSGFGLVSGGLILGLFSRFFADTRDLSYRYGETGIEGIPELVATTAIVLGAVILTALVAIPGTDRFRPDPPPLRKDPFLGWVLRKDPFLGWVVSLAFLAGIGIAVGDSWWSKYFEIRAEYPYFTRMPTAAAAFVLIMTGAVLILAAMIMTESPASPSIRSWGRIVTLTGLIPAIVVSAVAIRAGDDTWNIDHTTAGEDPVAAVPDRLGTERYRIPIMPGGIYDSSSFEIAAAGTGFVVGDRRGLTAYDGRTGAERWHYRRTTQSGELLPLAPDSLRYIGDNVVSAYWYHVGYRGFNATTGELLWTESDYERDGDAADWSWSPQGDGAVLVRANPTQVAGYEPRTGDRRWITDTDHASCRVAKRNSWSHPLKDAVVGTTIYRAMQCGRADLTWWHVLAIDAETGEIVTSNEIAHRPTGEDTDQELDMRLWGNTLQLFWRTTENPRYRYILITEPSDLDSAVTYTEYPYPEDISPDGSDLLVAENVDRTIISQILDADTQSPRYQMPERYRPAARANRAFLNDQLIELDDWPHPDSHTRPIRAWSRVDGSFVREDILSDCGRTRDTVGVQPVNGALLVLCRTGDEPDRDYRKKPIVIVGLVLEH
ncbi:PQQ-binding-like beta-propeller repeat protein [Nocardia sp. 004]|uniref:outer membrane protein assembly factor BamB family protein n=1 Tax=Nocardia sp. 004 TaxID=3385978 RepID=UPI0039A3ABCC